MEQDGPPVLTAVSSSARQLFYLLRCITFSNKAHITIDDRGLRVAVNDSSSMEASVLLDQSLFTTYNFNQPSTSTHIHDLDSEEDEDEGHSAPNFQISLPALLETLQIFGISDPNTTKPPWARDNPYPTSTAFSNNVLGINNLCRISYDSLGAPLSVILTEASIRTTCDLTTYEPEFTDDIPFDRTDLILKIVMQGTWLFDAISELSSTSPEKLTMYAKLVDGKPFFALSSEGTLGSAKVEFNNEPQAQQTATSRKPLRTANLNTSRNASDTASDLPSNLLETFQLVDPTLVLKSSYKFSLIQKAARAMGNAAKVSLRVDMQGVLSLQLMIELDNSGSGGVESNGDKTKCFVDFRIVPLADDDEDEGGEGDDTLMNVGAGRNIRMRGTESGDDDGEL